jgi:Domain of unknown function (DUF4340)
MLALVAGLVTFLYVRPKAETATENKYEVSQLKLADITSAKVEFPAQAPVSFEKVDGLWRMMAPYKMRADQISVQRILAIVAATSKEKFPTTDLAKYGLDNPQLKLTLIGTGTSNTFVFGTYNTVTEEQYVSFKDAIYLLTGSYSEAAKTQPIELVDKAPLAPGEAKQIAGFDFAHLEQWQDTRMNVDIADGKWTTNLAKAKITQNEMNEWLDFSWKQAQAKSVELYTPSHKESYPSLEVKLKDGKKVHFDKISEAPELLLGRPDEGVLYHFANDVGFNMLNPPLNLQ